jgi:beta-glucosidase
VYYNHFPTDKGYYNKRGSIEHPGKDYVFSNPDPLWAFGTGLSYTTFDYQSLRLSKHIFSAGETCHIEVSVKNSGKMDGKDVVQLYVRDKVSSVVTPVHELKRFKKVFIKAGQTIVVKFDLPISELSLYNVNMKKVVEPGDFELQIGTSDHIDLKDTFTVKEK